MRFRYPDLQSLTVVRQFDKGAAALGLVWVLTSPPVTAWAQAPDVPAAAERETEATPTPSPLIDPPPFMLAETSEPGDWERQRAWVRQRYYEWRRITDPEERLRVGEDILRYARAFYDWEVIQEIEIGDRLRETWIKIPRGSTPVTVEARSGPWTFDETRYRDRAFINRRITSDRIELWTPKEGWLFDREGTLLHHTAVPRRDGHGREWFGAFLPDGRWVTTDLWESDRQLHFYEADGTFVRTVRTAGIIGEPARKGSGTGRIDWARSDRDGEGWVMQLTDSQWGSDSRYFHVGPTGRSRELSEIDPWQLTHPRELGSRSLFSFIQHTVPSDDGTQWLVYEVASHGPGVPYRSYSLVPECRLDDGSRKRLTEYHGQFFTASRWHHGIFMGSRNFGFWPDSPMTFIDCEWAKEPVRGERLQNWTIFIDAEGEIAGCIAAERFADAADGRAMLFETDDGCILALNRDFTIQSMRSFEWPDGEPAPVEDLFDDLGLGLFRREEGVVLGRFATKNWSPQTGDVH